MVCVTDASDLQEYALLIDDSFNDIVFTMGQEVPGKDGGPAIVRAGAIRFKNADGDELLALHSDGTCAVNGEPAAM